MNDQPSSSSVYVMLDGFTAMMAAKVLCAVDILTLNRSEAKCSSGQGECIVPQTGHTTDKNLTAAEKDAGQIQTTCMNSMSFQPGIKTSASL